jgi:uncharacterized protein (UPF0276 family)
VDFVEVHAENFMTSGPNIEALQEIAATWPVSVHGVALSVGGEDPLDRDHLTRLKALLEASRAVSFSEHIAWSRYGNTYFNDLLPVPYNKLILNRFWERVDEIQQFLGRQILLENPASYVRFASDTMHEADFIAELVHRSGCGILLDLNNLYVSAENHGWDARDWLSRIQLGAVGEVHLAGHEAREDDDGETVLVDTHGADVSEPVWALYRDFIRRAGPRATVIERDNNVPALEELLHEITCARALALLDLEAAE